MMYNFKPLIFSLLALSSSLICPSYFVAQSVDDYEAKVISQRMDKESELLSENHSPLSKANRKALQPLQFFEVNDRWKLPAAFVLNSLPDTLAIPTSNGATKKFERYGFFVFDHALLKDTLYAYKRIYPASSMPKHEPYLFLPFTDLTTGEESYGGGRYIDVAIPEDGQDVIIDFNDCYNPYCAYGSGFSCPIPPKENFLGQYIQAGERKLID
ncbi:MAG: DUF1684 domain-containing protein [Salibacteraceae bacterium]